MYAALWGDELTPLYDMEILFFCHIGELLSRPYDITRVFMSYARADKSSI